MIDLPIYCLDFETANTNKWSVCEVGLVRYSHIGFERLIDQRVKYDGEFTLSDKHSICREDVQDCEDILSVYTPLIKVLSKQVVYTWQQFDGQVIEQLVAKYNVAPPDCIFLDAKKFVGRLIRHANLNQHAEMRGIEFVQHKAVEDASVALELVITAMKEADPSDVYEAIIESTYSLNLDKSATDNSAHPRYWTPGKRSDPKDFRVDHESPNYGKTYYFSGDHKTLSKHQINEKIAANGFKPLTGERKTMDFLIVGNNPGKKRMAKVDAWNEKQAGIEVMSLDHFCKTYGIRFDD